MHTHMLRRVATRLAQKLRRGPPLSRHSLAQHYLHGHGIEVGALHEPLPLPRGASARYVDFADTGTLQQSYPELAHASLKAPDIVADLETLQGIADASLDFVIANHVLEHVENPIKAVKTISRVLKSDGIAYLAIPEKTQTFDHLREITTLEHLIRDFEEGPDASLREHYIDWCTNVDRLKGAELNAKVDVLIETRANIHFHVWEYRDMLAFFHYMCSPEQSGLSVETSFLNGVEVIWVLSKR